MDVVSLGYRHVVTAADIRRFQNRGLRTRGRQLLRGLALDAASVVGSDAALLRPRVHVIYLHHVMPDEEQPFRRLIERLQRQHTFIPYSEAVARAASGDIDRPYASVTFDDGVRSQLRAGQILREYGVSACFFVCESMAEPRPDDYVREFCSRELGLPPVDFLTWRDMEELLAAGHEIGNHGRTHTVLATLTPGSALDDEIGLSLESLRRRLGDIKHYAWARGQWQHFSAAALETIFRTGHVSCASAMRGCHIAGPKRDPREICIRREHVVAADPLRHAMYFLQKSSSRSTVETAAWPPGWAALSNSP
jgi:hypothetical protein